jgi:hypothetical protein
LGKKQIRTMVVVILFAILNNYLLLFHMIYQVVAFVLDEKGEILLITKRFQTHKDALKAIKELKNDGIEKMGILLLTHKERK